jgi:hypothetical protein
MNEPKFIVFMFHPDWPDLVTRVFDNKNDLAQFIGRHLEDYPQETAREVTIDVVYGIEVPVALGAKTVRIVTVDGDKYLADDPEAPD